MPLKKVPPTNAKFRAERSVSLITPVPNWHNHGYINEALLHKEPRPTILQYVGMPSEDQTVNPVSRGQLLLSSNILK